MTTKKKLKKQIAEQSEEIRRLKEAIKLKTPIIKQENYNVIRFHYNTLTTYEDLLMRQEHYGQRMIEKWLDEEKNKAKRYLCDALYSRFDEFGTVYVSEALGSKNDGIVAYIDILQKEEKE